ncbi:hypothetical protein AVEN_33179-1 [Araneus ventricosus]|uniref:Uncharacterized protein n=1 Tax=Araneus ventricosus TaxID=182803 RepID=A0A4Y2EFB3_ARAVE|nr:hypothetical protein AVEN_233108-1 [Araneus ventricosus]GBM26572.1 hypothetical protein AVEN_33179-1 [Araneus ventricosus]
MDSFVGTLGGLPTTEFGAVSSTPTGYVNGVGFYDSEQHRALSPRCLREFVGGPFLWENREKGRPHSTKKFLFEDLFFLTPSPRGSASLWTRNRLISKRVRAFHGV